jgi:hypothetical protein
VAGFVAEGPQPAAATVITARALRVVTISSINVER